MRYFMQYWKNTTWRMDYDPTPLRFAASNQFAKQGVSAGDRVFVITNDGGRLLLGAALDVAAVLSPAAAKREFGSDVWPASHYIKARSPAKFTRELVVPTKTVRALRFKGGGQVLFQGSKIHQQTLRGVRELTPESAALLERLLESTPAPRKRAAGTPLKEIAGLFDRYPARARRSVYDALIKAITYAHSHYPDRWTLNLSKKRIRLIVGLVMCIEIRRDRMLLLTTEAGRRHDSDWSESGYKFGPGCGYVSFDAATPFTVSNELQSAVNGAIDVCGRANAGTSGQRGSYSEDLLRYLEQQGGTTLPRPDWLDAETEQKRLAALERSLADRSDLEQPEREAVAKYRCAQGLFRRRVMVLEASRCRVTEETNPNLLRASHIKPWRTSDDTEKQDGDNGLLLAPHIDALFDKGLISFADDGSMLLSEKLDPAVLQRWGIRYPLNVGPFREGQKKYLRHHRRTYRFGRK
jgi:hypothetical protein